MSDAEPRLLRPDFVALLCVQLATGFSFSSFLLLPKFMVEALQATPTQVGLVSAGFGLCSVCSVPLVGRMLDRGQSRAAILLGSGLTALSAFSFVLVDEPSFLPFLLRFAQGACVAMVVNGGTLLVSQRAPAHRLAEAVGLFAAANLVMSAVAPVAAELIAERYGYTPSFVMAGVSALIAFALALRLEPARFSRPPVEASLRLMLAQPTYLRMVAVLGLIGMGYGAVFTFVAPFALSLKLSEVRGFFVAFALTAVVMRLFVLRALAPYSPRTIARVAAFWYGIAVLAVAALAAGRLPLLGGFLGLAHGVFMPTLTALQVHETPEHERGRMLSLFNAAFGLGNAVVLGLGACVERFGYRPVFALTGALICSVPLMLDPARQRAASVEQAPLAGHGPLSTYSRSGER
ncbi:MAG TPA: MFS transporter [Polyangiales bacterium]